MGNRVSKFTKLFSFFKAILLVMTTVVWFVAVDYKAIVEENVLFFGFITSNLIVWSFYFIYKFCKVMNAGAE